MACYLYINSAAVISQLRKVVSSVPASRRVNFVTDVSQVTLLLREKLNLLFLEIRKASLRIIAQSTNPSRYE